jgi:hypothetical protein
VTTAVAPEAAGPTTAPPARPTGAPTGASSPASAAAPEETAEPTPGQRIKACFERLAVALIHRGTDVIVDKADGLADRLDEIKENGGVGLGAAFGAGYAYMAGKNPVVGALKGAWSSLSTGKKVGIVLGLVLLGLLSPVALVIALVALLVWAIVKAAKS